MSGRMADASSAKAFRKASPSRMADTHFADDKHARDVFRFRLLTDPAIVFASQIKESRI
jgi:hypothetical protein